MSTITKSDGSNRKRSASSFEIFGPARDAASSVPAVRSTDHRLNVAHYRSPDAMQDIARNPSEPGLIVCISTLALPVGKYEMWTNDRPVSLPHIPGFRTNVIDVGLRPTCWIGLGFDFMHYYLPQGHVDEVAEDLNVGSVRDYRFAISEDDLVVAQITKSMMPFAASKSRPCQFIQDHISLVLGAHIVQRYADLRRAPQLHRGGLAPWQKARARDFLMQNLDGNLRMADVARECGLSSGHFARAFKVSFGISAHRWLVQRRVERARELLSGTSLPLIEIAAQSGFGDQSAFTRTFHDVMGLSPGRWRRSYKSGAPDDLGS